MCAAVDKPVNVVMGPKSEPFSVADLAAFGVRRISVGSALSWAALGAFAASVVDLPLPVGQAPGSAMSSIAAGER